MTIMNSVVTVILFCCLSYVTEVLSYPERGYWSDWTSWSSCHGGCSGGYMERTRSCYGTRGGCVGDKRHRKDCYPSDCQHGHYRPKPPDNPPSYGYDWESWSSWSECDVQCGYGRQSGRMKRSRGCRHGSCSGDYDEYRDCYKDCPNYEWHSWGSWGDCDVQCGYGRQSGRMRRSRGCRHGSCPGDHDEYRDCYKDCPVYEWQSWGSWGDCDAQCGYGRQSGRMRRSRGCRHGSCPGDYDQYTDCYKDCPVYEWHSWGSWGECDVQCGYGRQSGRMRRSRGCRHGSCPGDYDEYRDCYKDCPEYPEWSSWSSWSDCDAQCGYGRQSGRMSRKRQCRRGSCRGDYDEYQQCYKNCPEYQEWESWGSWSQCDAQCGYDRQSGRMSRRRRCGRGSCRGDYDEYKDCYKQCPPPPPKYGYGQRHYR